MRKVIKILITLFILWSYSPLIATETLNLSAVVGVSNHAPVITEVIPNSNPRYLQNSSNWIVKQNYTIRVRDDEMDELNYTITVESNWWTVTPTSGTLNNFDVNNEEVIYFEYTTPESAVEEKTITITVTDWPNITIKTLNVYIY